MPTPKPNDAMRSHLSRNVFGRKHGDPTERPPESPRAGSRVRHAIEDAAERRQLRELTDWFD